MIKPDDSIIVLVNCNPEFFKNSFSKMEFLMGIDYMNNFIAKYKIPVIFTERELHYNTDNQEISKLRNRKEENRMKNMAPPSEYDEGFLEEFNKKIKVNRIVKTWKEDIFHKSSLQEEISKTGRKSIFLGGFFTDTDIFISAATANIREFNTIVVSDITSTYSERLYFQSLEMISQFVDVTDTRDLEQYFPV